MNATANKAEACFEELKRIEREKSSEGFRRGELKTLFESLAEKYNLSFYSVRNTYYKEVKNKTNSFNTQPIQPIQQIHKKSLAPIHTYSIGQIVKVKVTNIIDYGAFVETLDKNAAEGLIHISEVKDEYVSNIRDHFKIGDIVDAEIKKTLSNQRIEFSTKNIKKSILKPIKPIKPQNEDSLIDIINFLNGMVGALSPKAKNQLREIISEHGVVKFTIAMMQAQKTFENDLGLILLEQIKEKIEDCL